MLRTLLLASALTMSAAAFAQPTGADVAGDTAPANEVFSRLHRENRVLMDLAQDVRQRGSSAEAKQLADRVLHDHGARDRSLIAFARTHRISVDSGAEGSGNVREIDRDINTDIKHVRNLAGPKLDREFARIVLELDRDLLRVCEDGRRGSTSGAVTSHLNDEITFLRGEMGEAERLVRERR